MTNEEQNKFPLPSLDNSGIMRREELPSCQRFVKLCEECDWIYLNGLMGFYDKRRGEIVIQSPFINKCLQIDDCKGEFDGEYWIITDGKKPNSYPWHVLFLKIMDGNPKIEKV